MIDALERNETKREGRCNMRVNNALEFDFPEGFEEMSKEETAGLQMSGGGESIALSNKNNHLLVTVGWKRTGGFSGMILNTEDLRKKMEHDIRKSLTRLEYSDAGSSDMQVGGLAAAGFRYQYTAANGTDMAAESYVLKKDRTLYYFHLYSRRELAPENSELVRKVLGDAVWLDQTGI